jgi:hypothetical protein
MNHEIDAAGIGRTVLWVYGLAEHGEAYARYMQDVPGYFPRLSSHPTETTSR